MKYRVAWICLINGYIRRTNPLSHTQAVEAATLGERLYAKTLHWVEPVRASETIR